ncbi:MAG TPA: hypothetical protein VH230_16220 [Stellaceae bacterium]|nr:hypothetical protein [Stellaceae bacterium]
MSRNFPAFLDDHLRRLDQCHPALMHRARAAVPGAALHEPRIGLDETKHVNGQAEQRRGNLRVARLVPLAVRLGAEDQRNPAVVEAYFGEFVRRAARRFEKTADPEPAQPAARSRLGAPRRETSVAGLRQRVVEIGGKAPAIDGHAERAAIGEGGDHIAPPQAHGVPAVPSGGDVDQPLDQVIRLGLSGAAIGVDRHSVGEDAAHIHKDGRDRVDAAHRRRRRIGRTARSVRRQIGAEIGHGGHVERQPSLRTAIAALRPADEFLAPLGDPLDRPPEPPRRPQDQHPFGIEKILHAEPAADIGCGQLNALGRQPEHRLGELIADAVDALSGQQQVEATGGRVIIADHAGPAHRVGVRSVPGQSSDVAARARETADDQKILVPADQGRHRVAPVEDELRGYRTCPRASSVLIGCHPGAPQNCLAPSSFWVSSTATA